MTALFEAVRKHCPPEAWSEGVSLARKGQVAFDSRNDEEIAARVTLLGSAVSPRVTLFPADLEWECDCESPLDACEHVAAVAIASRQGVESNVEKSPILYRLSRTAADLHFERGVEDESGFQPIEFPLEAVASGRFEGPRFDATPSDLAVERALAGNLSGVIEKSHVPSLFTALARVGDRVRLDDEPVRVSPDPLLPEVRVEERDGGFFLCLSRNRAVSETFRNGVVRVDDTLRPEGEPELSGREWEELRRGRHYRAEDVGELAGRVLPELERRVGLDVCTDKLPGVVRLPPRLSLFFDRQKDALYVLPRIVYGDPPRARVEGERLVLLGSEVPLRERAAERELESRLERRLGLTLGQGQELSTETAIDLVESLSSVDAAIEGRGHEDFRLHGALEPSFHVRGDDFKLTFEAKGERRADPAAVLRAFRGGRSLVPLLEGGFAKLPSDWLERYGDQIEDLLAAREAAGTLPKAAIPDLARLARELDCVLPPSFERLQALASDFSGLPEAAMSPLLREALREYQKRGVDWLVFLRRAGLGALLADDMGLGKTIQALAALEGRSLVVAPTSVLSNWMAEASRFRPELSLCLYHGADRALDPGADLTVTSHALLRLDAKALAEVSWDIVVFDEAQAVRNPDTDLARAAFSLRAKFRMSLTGTPIENRLVDLWSQFHFLNPGFLGGLSDFEERYVRPTERGAKKPLERLRERIRPFFLRRLKQEVAPELPPRTELTLRAELSEAERDLYDAIRLTVRKDVLEGSTLEALEALLRLRQAACHPALVPGQEASTSSKTELLLSTLETASAEGHKSLVFSQWTSMLDLLEPKLAEAGMRFVRLDGATRDRAAVVDRFQNDPGVGVFLVSLKAGGTGLNLTAADHVFLFDPWWNPAVEEQAFDRAHRIGQENPVFVHRLVAAGTVEERILELQAEKRTLSEAATGLPAAALTRDDLLRLVE